MADFFDYTPVGFHFLVGFMDFKMAADIHFQSVSGLNVKLDTETYKEGGENRFVHTLPVRANYSNLVLKRGLITNSKVIDWCMDTFNNMEIKPVTLVVSLLNDLHVPVMSWNVVNAFPVKWSVSDFDAEKSQLVIETIEMKYQYFRLLKL